MSQLLDPVGGFAQGIVDFLPVIEVICECGVNIRQFNVVLGRNLVRAFSHSVMPDNNLLHRNSMPGNTRLTTANAWSHFDVPIQRFVRHLRQLP